MPIPTEPEALREFIESEARQALSHYVGSMATPSMLASARCDLLQILNHKVFHRLVRPDIRDHLDIRVVSKQSKLEVIFEPLSEEGRAILSRVMEQSHCAACPSILTSEYISAVRLQNGNIEMTLDGTWEVCSEHGEAVLKALGALDKLKDAPKDYVTNLEIVKDNK